MSIRNDGERGKVEETLLFVASIGWSGLHTVYGPADGVPSLLNDLLVGDRATQLRAAHELWAALAHQRVLVPDAALAALPAILLALDLADEELEVELLDICWGFVCGRTFSPEGETQQSAEPTWRIQLQESLRAYFRGKHAPRHASEESSLILDEIHRALR